MKKLLVPIMVLALLALTVPVMAQQYSLSLDVDKDVTIKETRIDVYTTAILKTFDPDSRADAEALKADVNSGNHWGYPNFATNVDPAFTDSIDNSFKNFTGIGQANQAAGSMNNQGNVVAAAYVNLNAAYASALAAVDAVNTGNSYVTGYCPIIQSDSITYSFKDFTGIGQVNQSAGSMNNQNNAAAVAAGNGTKVAMAASELKMCNTGNTFLPGGFACFNDTISYSFNGFNGIGQANQSAGNMNNQCNVVSVAATK